MTRSASPLVWAFHSPRRLASVLAGGLLGLTVAVGGISQALAPPTGGGSSRPAAHPTEPLAEGPSAPVAALEDDMPAKPTAADGRAAHAARKFVWTWLKGPKAASNADWRAAMRPYATSELLAGLAVTDRGRVPKAELADDDPKPRALGEYLSEFTVLLEDGRGIDVSVAYDGTTWRVTDLDAPAPR